MTAHTPSDERFSPHRLPRPGEWHSAIDKAITEAEQRGDFDNLPGHGKPLQFDANPLTGEIDVGYGLLKGAGFAPGWIELDKEIRAALASLDELRKERARQLIVRFDPHPPKPAQARQSWWRTLLFGGKANLTAPTDDIPSSRTVRRRRSIEDYLARAQEIDQKIAEYNASLPRELWHLERPRLTPEVARRQIEEALGPEPHPGL